MIKILKNTIRKIPVLAGFAKLAYDWRKEKKLQSGIKAFLKSAFLPFTDKAPDFYSVGHEPTIRCNLRCKMCYQGQTRELRREELDTDRTLAFYRKLKGRVKTIKLVGGEPFMRPDIFDLIAFWDKEADRVILQTNCTLINGNNIGKIKQYKHIKDIATSLDGPPELHDRIRGVLGTFDRLKKAVRIIQKERPDIPITIFTTLLIWDNLDKMAEIIDTAKELGAGSINILFEQVYTKDKAEAARKIFKDAFGWEEKDYQLNTQLRDNLFPAGTNSRGLKKKLSEIRQYGLKRGCFVNFTPYNYYNNLDKYLGEKPGRVFCLKLLSPELRINQRGEVIWCDIIEKSFGSLTDKTPDEIWLSKDYQDFRNYLFKNSLPICSRCCKASYI